MQHSPSEIKEKLLKALDEEYNVVDMAAVVEIISILEKIPITKETLLTTRLGKYINELRRKTTNEGLAKRAKVLVRRWRKLILPQKGEDSPQDSQPGDDGGSVNGGGMGNISSVTGSGGVVPVSPAHLPPSNSARFPLPARTVAQLPHPSPPPTSTAGGTSPGLPAPPPRSPVSQPYAPNAEAALRTHASNKRLRKESPVTAQSVVNGGGNGGGSGPWIEAGESSRDSFESSDSPGRKRKRKGGTVPTPPPPVVSEVSEIDIVKEKIASVARSPRVKTTQELLAGLQARRGGVPSSQLTDDARQVAKRPHRTLNSLIPGDRSDASEVSRNKSEHMERFLQSTVSAVESVEAEDDLDRSRLDVKFDRASILDEGEISRIPTLAVTGDNSVESILSRLPPIDYHILSEEEENGDEAALVSTMCPLAQEQAGRELADRVCSGERIEGVTGNYEITESNERIFREWHECVTLRTGEGIAIIALPYVVID